MEEFKKYCRVSLFTKCCSISPSLYLTIKILPVLFFMILITNCVSDKVNDQGFILDYQETLVERGPQERTSAEGLGQISPVPDSRLPGLKEIKETTGKTVIYLELESAVVRALASSPEITVLSFDPSIAKESIAVAVSEFDVTVFGQLEYDENDFLPNDIFRSGRTHSSLLETGIKQKGVTGAEWSLAYSLTRSYDESVPRKFTTAYEPTMTFELRQPLLRNAWPDINLAGVNISKLNYRIALAVFRRKAEDISTQVIALYWTLHQARRNVEIQQDLLEKTIKTLKKVRDRKDIDANLGNIKQAEASVKSREAVLFKDEKILSDVQDRLVRLLADHRMNLTDALEIIPTTAPDIEPAEIDQSELLNLALKNNPGVIRAKLELEVEEINVKIAKRQRMPLLDFVASAQLQGLSDAQGEASEMISGSDYTNYTIGLTLEFPLGNREKKASFRLRKLKYSKALSNLNNVLDQVAVEVRERIRFARTAHREIQVQKDAVNASRIHLQVLQDIEIIRKKLTPEFLLAKIQAQSSLAIAQKAEIKAIVDYNIALIGISQAVGTVLDMRSIQTELPLKSSGGTVTD